MSKEDFGLGNSDFGFAVSLSFEQIRNPTFEIRNQKP